MSISLIILLCVCIVLSAISNNSLLIHASDAIESSAEASIKASIEASIDEEGSKEKKPAILIHHADDHYDDHLEDLHHNHYIKYDEEPHVRIGLAFAGAAALFIAMSYCIFGVNVFTDTIPFFIQLYRGEDHTKSD